MNCEIEMPYPGDNRYWQIELSSFFWEDQKYTRLYLKERVTDRKWYGAKKDDLYVASGVINTVTPGKDQITECADKILIKFEEKNKAVELMKCINEGRNGWA